MHRSRALVAVILVAVGLVWIGQGTSILKGGSFMVGDARWAWIGLACVIGGLLVALAGLRRRRT